MRLSRPATSLLACLVASACLPAVAGSAAHAAASSTSTGTERVLLTLTPHDRGALHALAHSHGRAAHRSSRSAALRQALPTAADRRSVVDAAEQLGLRVDRVATMAVLVSGPAARVDALFGSARSIAPRSHVQHPLPDLPAALRGRVTVAFGGDDNRPAFRHFATDTPVTGAQLRAAYGDTVTDPLHGGAPTAAAKAETIATVQLSGWHSGDLTTYADQLRRQTGQAWPAPRYTGIDDPLLPSCVRTHLNGRTCDTNVIGDDVEVALDQEAIYAVAPYARQRAYLSGNDLLGMYDALASVGDDATDPTVDRHIVAASISWGFCETDLADDPSADSLYAAFEDVLSYDLASGVTVFAASGDNGRTCDPGNPKTGLPPMVGVSYPASSPQVVSVGGTQSPSGADPSDPTLQTAWNDQTGSSGGGLSKVFPRPSYQDNAGTNTAMRAVPDISALAGNPGFRVVSSGPTGGGIFGGTSLASPVTAATYAAQVAEHGYSWGVGDILPGLYAQASSFVDVTPAGYDRATGLGSPNWSALVAPALGGDPHLSVLRAYSASTRVPVAVRVPNWQTYDSYRITVDADHDCRLNASDSSTPPNSVRIDDFGFHGGADGIHQLTLVAIKAPATPADTFTCHYSDAFVFVDTTRPLPHPSLAVGHGHRDVVASWSAGDSGGSGVNHYDITLRANGRTVYHKSTSRRGSHAIVAHRGTTYALTVQAVDRAGNARTTTAQLVDDRHFGLSSGWSRESVRASYEGTVVATDRAGARARARATGRVYRLYVTTCPQCGRFAVYVGGKRRKTVDTFAKHWHHRVGVTVFTAGGDSSRTVVVKTLHRKNRHSAGHDVFLDALGTKA